MTTAAQNIHVFLPKLPLHKKHFFGWLKRAISSTACGTSTLKSPLLRAFFTPHVHSRLRKRLSRCTLDCGFKTLESPALRGFEVGPRALATAALYLVLLSNGLHRPKIRLKKFGFSLKTVPANIAKKLPPQRCFQPFLIPIFNFSHKRHTFAFAGESGYTTRLSAKDRTQRLTRRNRGLHSLVHSVVLCCRRYPFYSTTLLYLPSLLQFALQICRHPHCGRIRPDLKHSFFNLPPLSVFRDIFLRHVDCHRAVRQGGAHLTERLCPHIAHGVNAGNAGLRGLSGHDIAALVQR